MKIIDETIEMLALNKGRKLTSEQCINQGVEFGTMLLKTSFGMVVCKKSMSSFTLKVSSELVLDQMYHPSKPFNIKDKSKKPAKVFNFDNEKYSGLAVLQGEYGGELVIQFDQKD
ncbi:MAG: hypothetical protein RPS47_04765 [Colwellia sp.]